MLFDVFFFRFRSLSHVEVHWGDRVRLGGSKSFPLCPLLPCSLGLELGGGGGNVAASWLP
jgi:hypothetical protein